MTLSASSTAATYCNDKSIQQNWRPAVNSVVDLLIITWFSRNVTSLSVALLRASFGCPSQWQLTVMNKRAYKDWLAVSARDLLQVVWQGQLLFIGNNKVTTRTNWNSKQLKCANFMLTGDFFRDELPKSDLFVLSHVVHNWDDEHLDILMKRVYNSLNHGNHYRWPLLVCLLSLKKISFVTSVSESMHVSFSWKRFSLYPSLAVCETHAHGNIS